MLSSSTLGQWQVPGRQSKGVRKLSRKAVRSKILLEMFEPRILLSGTYLPGNLTGTWALGGLNKAGSLTFDGNGAVTAGSWVNQDGSPNTQVVAGLGSTYTVGTLGPVGMTLATEPVGSTVGTSTTLSGIINATADVVALNEEASGVPTFNGLDVLVNNTGTFATSDLAATWNVAAQDFRGTVTINAAGHVTGGLIYLESNQHSAKVTGGTATLNADGTGTLALTTAFSGANSAYAAITLNITMNASKDTVVANASSIGQPATAPQTGTVPAELAVLVKSAGVYASSDVVGVTWTLDSALGTGSITFQTGGVLTGTLNTVAGTTQALTGNYSLGGNGTLLANITATTGLNVTHFSLYGAINRSKNLIALDRAIANPGTNSSLTILTSAADHAPTERALAVLPQSAFQTSALTIDFPTLATASSVNDVDHDTLSFLITAVPAASGTLAITHGGVTSAVVPGSTYMVSGDTLTWTPSLTAPAQADAFSIQGWDGTKLAANATEIVISTSPLPLVSAVATKGVALEADAGTQAGDGKIQIQRAGGNQTLPSTITLGVSGSAQQGVNYNLIAPDGVTVLSSATPTVIIPAGKSSVTLTVAPLQDNVVDPTLSVVVTVAPDPNASSSSYIPSVHAAAQVNVIDSSPIVTITPRQPSIMEGNASVNTFIVTRLAAQGANLNNPLTVDLSYGGTFDTADDLIAPASVTFLKGQVKKVVTLTTINNNIANPTETLTATISGAGFQINGSPTATVNVLDASPIVSVTVDRATTSEAKPGNPAKFTVHRTGSIATALTVDFSTAAGGTFGTLGANYTLTDASGNALTTSVVIPAGKSNEAVFLTPIDDGANDPTLHPVITLLPDGGPSYHLAAADQATLNILNDNRPPTIANNTVSQTTTLNTALSLTYSQLVTLSGAALAPGETHGVLQLKVVNEFQGTLQVIPQGSVTPTAAPVGTLIDSGDTLVWTPPAGRHGVTLNAFSLTAVDGALRAMLNSRFSVAIT